MRLVVDESLCFDSHILRQSIGTSIQLEWLQCAFVRVKIVVWMMQACMYVPPGLSYRRTISANFVLSICGDTSIAVAFCAADVA